MFVTIYMPYIFANAACLCLALVLVIFFMQSGNKVGHFEPISSLILPQYLTAVKLTEEMEEWLIAAQPL